MQTSPQQLAKELAVTVPESCRVMMTLLCHTKKMPPEEAIAHMIFFACRLVEETPLQKGMSLLDELDFSRGYRRNVLKRTDELLTLVERGLIESHALQGSILERKLKGEE